MNTSLPLTLLWLVLAADSFTAIAIAQAVQKHSKVWAVDRWMDYTKGFCAATGIITTILFLASL